MTLQQIQDEMDSADFQMEMAIAQGDTEAIENITVYMMDLDAEFRKLIGSV